jgi:hypothetical protein
MALLLKRKGELGSFRHLDLGSSRFRGAARFGCLRMRHVAFVPFLTCFTLILDADECRTERRAGLQLTVCSPDVTVARWREDLRGPVEGLRLLSVTCGRTPACECQTTDRYFLETWFIGRKCAASGTRPCKPGPARPIPVHLSMGALPESPFLASVPSGWRDRLFFSPRIQMAHPFLSGSTSRRTSCLRVGDNPLRALLSGR